MKKILVLTVALIASGAISAQQAAGQRTQQQTVVTLQNMEDSWLYFVMDPKDLSGLTPSSPLLSAKIASFFSAQTDDFPFTGVKPRTGLTLEGLPVGQHLLIGFFVLEDKTEFPVRVISIQVDTTLAQRYYEIFQTPPLLSVARGMGRLARFGKEPVVAQTAPAATTGSPAAELPAVSPMESFKASYRPASFSSEKGGNFAVHGISDSEYWNRDGTRISAISGGKNSSELILGVTSASGFSKNVSYFFYLFTQRKTGTDNSYTIELKPVVAGYGGMALLWKKSESLPISIGKVTVNDQQCVLTLKLSELPSEVNTQRSGLSMDFTACYFDPQSGTYEEFFYSTIDFANIPGSTR